MAAHYPLGADIEITHVGYSSGGTRLGCISFEFLVLFCRVIATQVLLRKAALSLFVLLFVITNRRVAVPCSRRYPMRSTRSP